MPSYARLPVSLPSAAAFGRAAAARFSEERCFQLAGSLTYTTLLALVPLVTVALAVMTAFPVFQQWTGHLNDWLADNLLPEQIADAVTLHVGQFTQKAGRLTAVGVAALGFTAVAMMLTIDRGLNQLFRVTHQRPLAQRLLVYWAVLTLGPVLIGASISMTSYAVSESLGVVKGLPYVSEAILRAVPIVLTSAAMTLLYLLVPNRRVQPAHALAGGILAGLLFELMKRGFAFYVTRFPTYTLIYGAFAAVPIFLIWLYFSWVVVLAGASVTAVLPGYRRRERRGRRAGEQLYEALEVLEHLVRAQREGRTVPLARLARALRAAPEQCERLLERMADAGWLARTSGEGWVLAREAGSLTVGDLWRLFVHQPRTAAEPHAGLEGSLDVPLSQLFAAQTPGDQSERRLALASARKEKSWSRSRDASD